VIQDAKPRSVQPCQPVADMNIISACKIAVNALPSRSEPMHLVTQLVILLFYRALFIRGIIGKSIIALDSQNEDQNLEIETLAVSRRMSDVISSCQRSIS
jgi:hypothetical protein